MTVADLLEWEAWPDEMKRIAREAVREEMDDDVGQEEIEGAMDTQHEIDQRQFALVRKKLESAIDSVSAVHDNVEVFSTAWVAGRLADVLAALRSIPELLADVKEET